MEESPTDLLTLTVAQRYSVLVTARNDTSQNWMIHANMDTDMFDTVPPALNPNITSSITYNASAPVTDSGLIDEYHDVNDIALVPVEVVAQLPPASKTIELEVGGFSCCRCCKSVRLMSSPAGHLRHDGRRHEPGDV